MLMYFGVFQYLDRIGQLFFGLPPPQSASAPGGLFGKFSLQSNIMWTYSMFILTELKPRQRLRPKPMELGTVPNGIGFGHGLCAGICAVCTALHSYYVMQSYQF